MNYTNLTKSELIRYLDLSSTDPLVRKLVTLLQEEGLVRELTEVGMDPVTHKFEYDYDFYGPAEYINHLCNEVDFYQREREEAEYQIHQLEKEIKGLSTMTLMNFIADVNHKMEMNNLELARANNRAEAERAQRKEAEQKFEFWEKLNHGIK